MTIPDSKAALLAAIDRSFTRLTAELDQVPAGLARTPVMDGHAKGTQMSVADLVAYLVGWNELVLKWLARDAAGLPIHFPEAGFHWNELGRLALKFERDGADIPYPDLLRRLTAARAHIVTEIEVRDDDVLYRHPWYGKWTMGRMIQLNTTSPYENARRRLRAWQKVRLTLPC